MRLLPTFFVMAARNLRTHWLYVASGAFAIVVGFLGVALFRLYLADATSIVRGIFETRFMLGDVLIVNDRKEIGRRFSDIEPIDQKFADNFFARHLDEIEVSLRVLEGRGVISLGKTQTGFVGRGYEISPGIQMRGPVWAWDTIAGIPLTSNGADGDIVVGARLAYLIGCSFAENSDELSSLGFEPRERPFTCAESTTKLSAVTVAGRPNSSDARITGVVDGVFQELDSRIVLSSLKTTQRLLDTDNISYYAVRGTGKGNEFIKSFNEEATASGSRLKAVPWTESPDGDIFNRVKSVFAVYLYFIGGILAGLTSLSVFYSFLKSTAERSREIGTLRSIGFDERHVLLIFLIEAVFIAVCSSAVAVVLTVAATSWINGRHILYQIGGLSYPVPFRLGNDPGIYVSTFAMFLCIALASALIAIVRRARASISENLSFN